MMNAIAMVHYSIYEVRGKTGEDIGGVVFHTVKTKTTSCELKEKC